MVSPAFLEVESDASGAANLRTLLEFDGLYLANCIDGRREAAFQERVRAGGGSQFYFSGSPFSRLHPILQQGLRVMSNTAHQLHGSSLGAGIYLTKTLSTALGYAAHAGSVAARGASFSRSRWPAAAGGEDGEDAVAAKLIGDECRFGVLLCEVAAPPSRAAASPQRDAGAATDRSVARYTTHWGHDVYVAAEAASVTVRAVLVLNDASTVRALGGKADPDLVFACLMEAF